MIEAESQCPHLVISDILMPSMDGYEFVRQLRARPHLASTAVIFYTANYHSREAQNLASQCGVERVISKPDGRELIAAVAEVLSGIKPRQASQISRTFDREHLQVLTDSLANKADQLGALNGRLAALNELNVRLASEHDPTVLLEKVCAGARRLLGAKYAVLAITMEDPTSAAVWTSGIEFGSSSAIELKLSDGAPAEAHRLSRALRVRSATSFVELGLPKEFPRVQSALVAPISSLAKRYGWVCLCEKLGSPEFDADDEQMLSTLGALVGRVYENGRLYQEVQERAIALCVQVSERERLNRVYAMLSGISSLIVRVTSRTELFNEVCRLAVDRGNFAAAWCGWLEMSTQDVVPAGSSTLGVENRAAVGCNLEDINERDNPVASAMRRAQPVICNRLADVVGKVRLWERLLEQGHKSLACFPFKVEGKAVGCLLLAARETDFFDSEEVGVLTQLAADISFALDHMAKAERIHYLAYYDALTGLANRSLFHERLTQRVIAAQRERQRFGIVIADPERFQNINDTFGRYQGDELLRQLASALVAAVGEQELVARIGPGQFAVVIPNASDGSEIAGTVTEWWAKWLRAPFKVDANEIRVAVKSGIALFRTDGSDAETLLKNAELALRGAKATSETACFYAPQLRARANEIFGLENQLRSALANEEFVLYYQPKVDLAARTLQGLEALIRWRSPELGLVPPMKFIPFLEESGLIVEVGAWALHRANFDRRQWVARDLTAPRVAVNVSTVQLQHRDFLRAVGEVVGASGKDAGLDIEVTESVIMADASENIEKLKAIRNLGIGIAIDDFGTGYSSLGYLTKLPAQTIKIDRSFIVAMLDDPGMLSLVSTIITLAHSLNMSVVAEGVESEEQAKLLRLLRCDFMQGYLMSKPLTFEDTCAYIARSQQNIIQNTLLASHG